MNIQTAFHPLMAFDLIDYAHKTIPVAEEIAERQLRKKDNRRTPYQIRDDAYFGIALEQKVMAILAEGLEGAGIDVLPATSKDHDFILQRGKKKLHIDVKSIRPGAKTLTVANWEVSNAPEDTIYLVFEADRSNCEVSFRGYCTLDHMEPSQYNDSWFVRMGNLHHAASLVREVQYLVK